jgi:anti-sigma factor RsiW
LPISDHDVHAYADGMLPPDRAALVDDALARDAGLAASVGDIRLQSASLRDALDPVLSEPIPDRLLAAATPPSPQRRRAGSRRYAFAFATAATLVIGLAIGWLGRTLAFEAQETPVTFARQVAFAHALYTADARRPVEVWANEEKNLYTWLTRRLGHPVQAVDLTSAGYSLVGGRLVAGSEQPTALLMYENADKQRLTVQVRWGMPKGGETAFRYAVENGVGVFYWVDDDSCAYAISGTLDRPALLTVARLVHAQVSAAESAARKPAPG